MIWLLVNTLVMWAATGLFWLATRHQMDPIGLFVLFILGGLASVSTVVYLGAAMWWHSFL